LRIRDGSQQSDSDSWSWGLNSIVL
jgi:hypothetical protein